MSAPAPLALHCTMSLHHNAACTTELHHPSNPLRRWRDRQGRLPDPGAPRGQVARAVDARGGRREAGRRATAQVHRRGAGGVQRRSADARRADRPEPDWLDSKRVVSESRLAGLVGDAAMIFLDTSVFIHHVGRRHPLRDRAREIVTGALAPRRTARNLGRSDAGAAALLSLRSARGRPGGTRSRSSTASWTKSGRSSGPTSSWRGTSPNGTRNSTPAT